MFSIKVLASIVEVPRPLRDNQQNLILICLWHSPRQPSAEQLFGKVTDELICLLQDGIDININGLGKSNKENICHLLYLVLVKCHTLISY